MCVCVCEREREGERERLEPTNYLKVKPKRKKLHFVLQCQYKFHFHYSAYIFNCGKIRGGGVRRQLTQIALGRCSTCLGAPIPHFEETDHYLRRTKGLTKTIQVCSQGNLISSGGCVSGVICIRVIFPCRT